MKISRFLLTLAAACGLMFALWRCPAYAQPADAGSGSAIVAAGSGSGSAVVLPHADQLPNPATSPVESYKSIKALWHYNWAAALFGVLVMITLALAWAQSKLIGVPLLGKFAAWLAVNKRAVWIAGIGAGAAAALNAILDGGTWIAAIVLLGAKVFALMNPTTQSQQS